jgi:hypothetical protein
MLGCENAVEFYRTSAVEYRLDHCNTRMRHVVTTAQRSFTTFALLVVLTLLSWLTILPGEPRVYAPLNLLVVVPVFLSDSLLGSGGVFVAIAVVPALFCLWCWPVLRGRTTLPTRSVVLLFSAVSLSALSLICGSPYGVEHQSLAYVVGVAIINVICWVLLGGLAWLARRRPSFGSNLGFHAALFAWLAWCAFPYMGELP